MNETLRGIQAEQAAYEEIKDVLAELEDVDEETVQWFLESMNQATEEQVARAVERFERRLREGERPQLKGSVVSANDATILEIRRRMRARAAMPVPEPLAMPAPQPVLRCRRCGETGYAGQSPFSTLPDSGLCDDCL